MTINGKNPYPGLRAFRREESSLYFGRETEVKIFGAELLARRLLILHGKTGSGKTSFFEAGVQPHELGQYNFDSYRITIKDNPFESIEFRCLGTSRDLANFKKGYFFQNIYKRLKMKKDSIVVFFFDQFEDIFTTKIDVKLRKAFAYEIGNLVYNTSIPIKIVIGIRNDFLFELDNFKIEIPDIYKSTYYLHDLTPENAKKAIQCPASKYNLTFDDNLVETLIKDLKNDNNQIYSPPLQIICNKLAATAGNSDITLNDYENKLGGKDKILKSFVEDILNDKMIISNKKTVVSVLEQLHFQGQTKYPRPFAYLEKRTKLGHRKLNTILTYLEKNNILTKDSRDNTIWYELKHDYLISPIENWTNKFRQRQKGKYRMIIFFLIFVFCIFFVYFLKVSREPSFQKAQEYFQKGQKELFAGNNNAAIIEFNKSINEVPDLPSYEGIISANIRQDNIEAARESYIIALGFERISKIDHRRISEDAYEYFTNKGRHKDAREFILEHINKYPAYNLNEDQRDNILLNYFKEKSFEHDDAIKRNIVNLSLIYIGSPLGFKINDLTISNSFEFFKTILAQEGYAEQNDSFEKFIHRFIGNDSPEIGDIILFDDWKTIIGLRLGQGPKPLDEIYYLSMNIKSPKVTIEVLDSNQKIRYLSISH